VTILKNLEMTVTKENRGHDEITSTLKLGNTGQLLPLVPHSSVLPLAI
jgi:hypothetical protein